MDLRVTTNGHVGITVGEAHEDEPRVATEFDAPVETPAGRFARGWQVEFSGPAWRSRLWWAQGVGFVLARFDGRDGARIELSLSDVERRSLP